MDSSKITTSTTTTPTTTTTTTSCCSHGHNIKITKIPNQIPFPDIKQKESNGVVIFKKN